jgi:TIR domain
MSSSPPQQPRIFISYIRKDESFARKLAARLSDYGVKVWLDTNDIPAGMNWSTAIQEGLKHCDQMLLIISPDSMASKNVADEWQYYLDHSKPIIPILLRPADIHFQLSRLQYIDFSNLTFDQAFQKLQVELAKERGAVTEGLSTITPVKTDALKAPVAGWSRLRHPVVIVSGAITLLLLGIIVLSSLQPQLFLTAATETRTPPTSEAALPTSEQTPNVTLEATNILPLPSASFKQIPREITFKGCPPGGDTGDEEYNALRNRVDNGNYQPILYDALYQFPYPLEAENGDRSAWSDSIKLQIERAEGLPISIEGYIWTVKIEGAMAHNCHSVDDPDYFIWLTDYPKSDEDRREAIIAAVTPRIRFKHPQWTYDQLNQLSVANTPIRLSGWILFDHEHPGQTDQIRVTSWEIFPVMNIEIRPNTQWVNLDDYQQ